MNRSESVDTDSCMALGGLKPGMAQHLCDIPDVSSAFEHQSGNLVTKEMAAPTFVHAGIGKISADLA